MANVLIAGCGDLGTGAGLALADAGHRVWGLRRHPERLPGWIRPLQGDLTDPDGLPELPRSTRAVYFITTPDQMDDTGYRRAYVDALQHALGALERQGLQPERVIFVSSTGVYGVDDGSRVDEDTPALPQRFSGRRLLEAERLLEASPYRGIRLRLGGIYGPGRERMLDLARAGQLGDDEPPTWTNRIHRDDAVGILHHLFTLADPDPVYLGVDTEPALKSEVLHWLAARLGTLPADAAVHRVDARDGARGRRCDSRRLQDSGYRFRYPDYRAGFAPLLP